MNNPWLVARDFNCVLTPNERSFGTTSSSLDMQNFSDCCFQLGLDQINTTGAFYTWSNGSIWSKIDRALCNIFWHSHFSSSFCVVPRLESTSDHSPLLITTEACVAPAKHVFRFNNALVDVPVFKDCVKTA